MTQPFAESKFKTDTATIAVFDPASIAHRAGDDADWWSVPSFELEEINAGRVLFAALVGDGIYSCKIFKCASDTAKLLAILEIKSGCLYIGAGEEVPGGGFGPGTVFGGMLLPVQSGSCMVQIAIGGSNELHIYLSRTSEVARNNFVSSPELC